MISEIIEMYVLFEVVPATVWNNSIVESVNFSDRPRVKSRLRKIILEKIVAAYLYISGAYAKAAQLRSWNRTFIIVMQDPTSLRRSLNLG